MPEIQTRPRTDSSPPPVPAGLQTRPRTDSSPPPVPSGFGSPLADALTDPLTAPPVAAPPPGAGTADPAVPRQKSAELDKIYAQAREALPEFQKRVSGVASSTHGVASFPPVTQAGKGSGPDGALDEDDKLGLKGKKRAKEKIAADYKDDAARLVDVLRGSVVYQTMEDLEKGKAGIGAQFKIVREKDRFQKGKDQDGYRDVNYNLETPNGHIAEVQLHLEQILQAKSGEGTYGKNEDGRSGHKIYEEYRDLEAKKKEGFPDIKDPELKKAQMTSADKRLADLKVESKAHYDKAFKAAGGKVDDEGPASASPGTS